MVCSNDVMPYILDPKYSTDGIIRDVSDGTNERQNPLLSDPQSLKIHLYFDDFQVSNPLGNKNCEIQAERILFSSRKHRA